MQRTYTATAVDIIVTKQFARHDRGRDISTLHCARVSALNFIQTTTLLRERVSVFFDLSD